MMNTKKSHTQKNKDFFGRSFSQSKKAQVTIFVIIGIVLIAGAGLFFFFTQNRDSIAVDDFAKDVTTAQPSFKPVQDYVELCMGQITRDALNLIGSHGGYVNPFDTEYEGFFIYNEGNVGDNDGVLLGDDESTFIPYWVKSTSSVEKDFLDVDLSIPTPSKVQWQIQQYVDNNLDSCLDNFSSLSNLGFEVVEYEKPISQALLTEDDVAVKTSMKLVLEKDGQTQEFEKFLVRDPIPLLEYLTKASLIAFEEYNSQYLENLVVHLVSYYGRVDSKSLPPMSMYTNDNSALVWTQLQINDQLRSLLNSYVSLFRFEDTENAWYLDDSRMSAQEKEFYNSFILSTIVAPKDNLSINHIFLDWDIYSKVTSPTSDGEIITIIPEELDGFIMKAPESDTYYNFFYDVTYPVVVELVDDGLPDGSTYSFLFGLEANVRNNLNNQDYQNNRGPIEWDPNQIKYTTPDSDVEQEVKPGELVGYDPVKKLFSDPDLYTSGNVTISAYDTCTGEPLGEVFVSAGVADYAQKRIGMTEFDVYGNAVFNSQLPVFNNGYLVLKKDRYQDTYVPLSTYEGQEQDFGSYGMNKIINKKVKIQVLEKIIIDQSGGSVYSEDNWWYNEDGIEGMTNEYVASLFGVDISATDYVEITVLRNITPSEQAVLFFTKITNENDLSPYSQFILANNSTAVQNIDLVSGKYKITGMLIDSNGIIVPEDSKKVCDGIDCWFMSEEEEYIPDEPIEIKPATWGGLEFTEELPWSLSRSDLCNSSNELVITLFKFPPPVDIDSLQNLGKLTEITKQYRADLLPTFVPLNESEQ